MQELIKEKGKVVYIDNVEVNQIKLDDHDDQGIEALVYEEILEENKVDYLVIKDKENYDNVVNFVGIKVFHQDDVDEKDDQNVLDNEPTFVEIYVVIVDYIHEVKDY